MARGIVVVTPAKQIAKAAQCLNMDVKMLFTVLSLGQEAVLNDEEIKLEYGAKFVREVEEWNFLETIK